MIPVRVEFTLGKEDVSHPSDAKQSEIIPAAAGMGGTASRGEAEQTIVRTNETAV